MRLLALGHGGTPHARIVDMAKLVPGERVLDVGCGTGSLALTAKTRVGTAGIVCGVDASGQMLKRASHKARRRAVQIDFRVASVEELPYPDHGFDVVFSTLMLHHLPRPVRRRCAGEMARVLRDGGRVLVADFQAPARGHKRWTHLHRHGGVAREEVASLLQEAGFRVLQTGEPDVLDLHCTLAVLEKNP
jgi:ubiquinone/menaquinone biosynthesis C-methylase UbiE